MSRVFDGNSANFLGLTGLTASAVSEGTMGVWFKKGSFTGDGMFLSTGTTINRRWLGHTGSVAVPWGFYEGMSAQARGENTDFSANAWQLMIWRKEGGTWKLTLGEVELAQLIASADFITSNSNLRLGQSTSGSGAISGKLAHAFVMSRGISDAEVASLAAGQSPSSLTPSGRMAYYLLDGSSLDNVWQSDSGVGPLAESGAVAVDAADNPPVDPPVVPPAITITSTTPITPGTTLTATASNFAAAPTTISLSDGASPALTPALTATASGDDYNLSALIADFKVQADTAGEGNPVQGLRIGTITATVE